MADDFRHRGAAAHPFTPWGALGITNRPDHLLHFVLDAVERQHYEDPHTAP